MKVDYLLRRQVVTVACVLFPAAMAVSTAGCNRTGEVRSEHEGSIAEERVPPDFSIVLGSGGGFAGTWSGYIVGPDGAVSRWSGVTSSDDVEQIGSLSREELAAAWTEVEKAKYFSTQLEETGNMTAFLEITADGRKHRTSWVPTVEGFEPVTAPVEKLYLFCRDLASTARVGE